MGGATRGQAHKFDPTTTGELTRYGRVDQGGTGGGGGGGKGQKVVDPERTEPS